MARRANVFSTSHWIYTEMTEYGTWTLGSFIEQTVIWWLQSASIIPKGKPNEGHLRFSSKTENDS